SDTRCLSSFPTTLTGFRGIPIAQVNSAAVLTGPRMLGPGPFGALGGVNAARGTVFDGLQFVGTQAIAVSADPDAAVIVRDCKFIDGDSPLGGAINARSVSLLIESSEFTGCEASVLGGAIRHEDGVLIVRDSSFLENTAFLGDGGALFSDSDAVLIERSEFVNNRLLEDFQFRDGGGAVYIERGDVTIEDSVFTGNRADLGGAIYFHAGAVQPLIARSVFDSNNAAAGGAILAEQSATLFVRESLFTRGDALGSGAIDADSVFITDSDFVDNFGAGTGAISASTSGTIQRSSFRDNFGGQGGAINIRNDLDIIDCEFINNLADDGGAVLSRGRGTITNSHFESNFAFDDGGAVYGPAVVSASVLRLNTAGRFGGAAFEIDSFVGSEAVGNEADVRGGGIHRARLVRDSDVLMNLSPSAPGVVNVGLVQGSMIADNIDTDTLWAGSAVTVTEGETTTVERSFLAGVASDTVLAIDNGSTAVITDSLVIGGARANTTALIELSRSTVASGANFTGILLDANNSSAIVAESTVVDGGTAIIDPDALVLLVQSHLSSGTASVLGSADGLEVFGELSEGDPKFADRFGDDGNATSWRDNDYRPRGRSPLIDRGLSIGVGEGDLDLFNLSRISDDP
ncbi:MAG: right-handed parallel beta-helix repeat-containing protein, partial [Planctomycetota bacterium]